MSSTLSFGTHRAIECVTTLRELVPKCSNPPHCHIAATNRGRARCGAAKPTFQNIIRSVASDLTKVNRNANNSKVNNSNSSTNSSSTLPHAINVSPLPVDLNFIRPHLHSTEAHKEIPPDVLDCGRLVDNKLVYRQIFVIRSYEVGFDKTAPINTITNLFQETSLNHVGMMNFVGDGMGTTHAMIRNRLIWVVTRMHIEMMHYPAWGDVVQIDSWVSSSGKNGMRRDFVMQDYSTGCMLGRATSNWAMMNQDTRRLSKMPEEVRAEISQCFLERSAMDEEDEALERIPLLDESAPFRATGLVPKVLDLDMNQHVNHVKYIDWILECVPQSLLMSSELRRVTLEYKRECGKSDSVECLAQSDMATHSEKLSTKMTKDFLNFTHSLRLCDSRIEVLRARTRWIKKKQQHHYH